ncbi:DNA/RNA helicase domain-containing protein [Gordonia phthalatica]|uniref:Schlafen group 3-like DNA/RNA helicase domain-containing protein n=1 Tax=Gordonia phthalatica TaxID=1136941 RepID=A0A0N9NDY4_9ACTN|nr:hypothetical protein ACH46_13470 [Gordonia phthalatica]
MRVPVFLLDEHQVARPGEMGSLEQITEYAESSGLEVVHIALESQFRCGGSEEYITWAQRLLGLDQSKPLTQWFCRRLPSAQSAHPTYDEPTMSRATDKTADAPGSPSSCPDCRVG